MHTVRACILVLKFARCRPRTRNYDSIRHVIGESSESVVYRIDELFDSWFTYDESFALDNFDLLL